MKALLRIYFFTLAVVLAMGLSAYENDWPLIKPLEGKHTFKNLTGKNDTPFEAFINNRRGVPLYKLECHNGNYEYQSQMNFSGDFQCALFALKDGTRSSTNLLAADTKNELSSDWWNRGRMRSAQLRGECLKYPNYSTDRHFKLRGMILTLRFTNLRWDRREDQRTEPLLIEFTFILKVVPDESAHSSRAELTSGPNPPESCYP